MNVSTMEELSVQSVHIPVTPPYNPLVPFQEQRYENILLPTVECQRRIGK